MNGLSTSTGFEGRRAVKVGGWGEPNRSGHRVWVWDAAASAVTGALETAAVRADGLIARKPFDTGRSMLSVAVRELLFAVSTSGLNKT